MENKTPMPITILKDHFENGKRTYLYKYNEYLNPISKSLLKDVESGNTGTHVYTPYHYHDGIEIIRVEDGECNVIINDKTFHLTNNDLCFVNPFEPHAIYLKTPQCLFNRVAILFQPNVLFQSDGNILPCFEPMLRLKLQNFIPASHPACKVLLELLDQIVKRYAFNDHLNEQDYIATFGDVVKLYAILMQNNLNQSENVAPYLSDFAMQVTDYINNNYKHDITTKEIADYCQYTVEHFCRLFKKCFDNNFKDYFNRYRIQRSKYYLLMQSNQNTIAEIAYELGFNSQNHFTNTFKKYTGMLPSKYIQKKKAIAKEIENEIHTI